MSSSPRVLLVGVGEDAATSLTSFLSKNGLETVAAFDGTAALRLSGKDHFDMLVVDVTMSSLDGVRIATVFRNINPASRIFLITTAYEDIRQLLIDANLAWDFGILLKPIDPLHLVEILRSEWNHGANLSQ